MSRSARRSGFLVECYWPGIREEQIAALAGRAHTAASWRRGRRGGVELAESVFIPVDETVFWLFEGCEDDVRAVAAEAGITYERILESLRIDRVKHGHRRSRGKPKSQP
jgi:hypothetical protein